MQHTTWPVPPANFPKPTCHCYVQASTLQSRKNNENFGRYFFGCANRDCNFFQWYEPNLVDSTNYGEDLQITGSTYKFANSTMPQTQTPTPNVMQVSKDAAIHARLQRVENELKEIKGLIQTIMSSQEGLMEQVILILSNQTSTHNKQEETLSYMEDVWKKVGASEEEKTPPLENKKEKKVKRKEPTPEPSQVIEEPPALTKRYKRIIKHS